MDHAVSFIQRNAFVVAAGLIWACHLPARAASPPPVDELLSYLHIDKAERADLLKGKILSTNLMEGSQKELAVGVVMFVPAPVEKLVEFVRSGQWFTSDRDIIAVGELTEPVTADSFPGEAASQSNLSAAEAQALRSGESFPQLLLNRFEAYRQRGLAGIEPYDRGGGKVARPGDELQGALQESELLAQYSPELLRALQTYPREQPADARHRYFWINQKVEGRPTFILTHRMVIVRPEGSFMAERQFYVGHSYNSLFLLAGCLPVEGGSVVFYSNHTSTDQVAGLASGMRHSIGRGQMRDEIMKSFERIRETVTRQ
jgi:hypothetical protein